MENSKALLNFDVLGWFTAIIQIQKYEYYVNNLPFDIQFPLRIVQTQDRRMYIHILLIF